MKPLPKTVLRPRKAPATALKAIDTALSALRGEPSLGCAQAVLAAAAKAPYASDGDCRRTSAEWEALAALIELDESAVAKRVWQQLVADWAAQAPLVGGTGWYVLARAKSQLNAATPARLRARVRTAWAWGVISNVFEYSHGVSAKPPTGDGPKAWRQACIEITLQNFESARACVDAVRAVRGYDYTALCLEIMLRREQGDADGALASYHTLVALGRKRPRQYGHWDVIAAMYVILGVADRTLAEQIHALWTAKGKATDEASIFTS